MDENRYLNVDNFKRWMKSHEECTAEDGTGIVGSEVQPKYGPKRTIRNISVESGKPGKVIREFMDGMGVIREVSGNECLVGVPSGEFTINRKFLTT